MSKRITCKVHDDNQRVIKVGVDSTVFPMQTIWAQIHNGSESYYTLASGREAAVRAVERQGTRYLTTSPDGITDNNLDELPMC